LVTLPLSLKFCSSLGPMLFEFGGVSCAAVLCATAAAGASISPATIKTFVQRKLALIAPVLCLVAGTPRRWRSLPAAEPSFKHRVDERLRNSA
jgi:hypothetical protein